MTDRTRHEIDLIDSANKDRSYQQANIKKGLAPIGANPVC